MRYSGRVIAMLTMIISALMVGGPARAGQMDNWLRLDCGNAWYSLNWGLAATICDEAAYDVAWEADLHAHGTANVDAVERGVGRTRIDMAYPAAFALARSAYAYYAVGRYTKAEAQRQRAITLLSNAYTSPKYSALFKDGPEALMADLENKAFFQNDAIIDGGKY